MFFGLYDVNFRRRRDYEDVTSYKKEKAKHIYNYRKKVLKKYSNKQIRDDIKRRDDELAYSGILAPISIVIYYLAFLCASNSVEFIRTKIMQIITDLVNFLFVPPVTAIGTTLIIAAFMILYKSNSKPSISKK